MTITLRASYITVDTFDAPVLTFLSAYDSGASNSDKLTNLTSWGFHLSGAQFQLGDTIYIYDGGDLVASAVTTDFIQVVSDLTWDEGVHIVTAKYGRGAVLSNMSEAETITCRTTAPVLSSPTAIATGQLSGNISVTTDVADGIWYYIVDEDTGTATAAQIIAGVNSLGVLAIRSGNQVVTTTGVKSIGVDRIWYNTAYKMQAVHEDVAGNRSNIATATLTTDALTTPLVWESGVQAFAYAASASKTIITTPPGRHTLVVFFNQIAGVSTMTFNGDTPTEAYPAAPYFAYMEFDEPTTVVVNVTYTGPAPGVMNYIVLIGAGVRDDYDVTFHGGSGSQGFVNATIPTGGIGLAHFCGFNSADLPTSWVNATSIASTDFGYVNVSVGAAIVTGTWSSVSCTAATAGANLFSTTWTFDP